MLVGCKLSPLFLGTKNGLVWVGAFSRNVPSPRPLGFLWRTNMHWLPLPSSILARSPARWSRLLSAPTWPFAGKCSRKSADFGRIWDPALVRKPAARIRNLAIGHAVQGSASGTSLLQLSVTP